MSTATEVPKWLLTLLVALAIVAVAYVAWDPLLVAAIWCVAICLPTIILMRRVWGWWLLFVLFCLCACAWLWHLTCLVLSYWIYTLPQCYPEDVKGGIVAMAFFGVLLTAMLLARPSRRR